MYQKKKKKKKKQELNKKKKKKKVFRSWKTVKSVIFLSRYIREIFSSQKVKQNTFDRNITMI